MQLQVPQLQPQMGQQMPLQSSQITQMGQQPLQQAPVQRPPLVSAREVGGDSPNSSFWEDGDRKDIDCGVFAYSCELPRRKLEPYFVSISFLSHGFDMFQCDVSLKFYRYGFKIF